MTTVTRTNTTLPLQQESCPLTRNQQSRVRRRHLSLCLLITLLVPFLIGDIRASFLFLVSNSSAGYNVHNKSSELVGIDIDVADKLSRREKEQNAAMSVDASTNAATGQVFRDKQIRIFGGKSLTDYDEDEQHATSRDTTNSSSSISINTTIMNKQIGPSLCRAKKWGVVTTIFDPTDAILRLLSLDWCLVIVSDLKTPKDYMAKLQSLLVEDESGRSKKFAATVDLDRAFFLSVEEQELWAANDGFFGSFVRSTPWNHFSRKNIGYLFAILHKADFIFDFDDDNYIKLRDNGLVLDILSDDSVNDVSVAMLGTNAFNHHPMMGATVNGSWARGFPLELLQNNATYGTVAFKEDIPISQVGVIQFLADNNPDIDAIHRITKPLPMNFQGSSSVLVPKHSFAPYNAQATIHSKLAFWGLLLPGTVTGRVSDIWRSYFAQCIFADTELRLVFAPPKIHQFRNEHNNLGDLNAEQDLYNKAGELVTYLSSWTSSETRIAKRFEHLYIDLYEHGYIELEDVTRAQFWLGVLLERGYQFPLFKGRHRNVAVMGQFNYATESIVSDVIFWTQKTREFFSTVVAVGPFNDAQVKMLRSNSISVRSSIAVKGNYSPLSNLNNLLREYKNSTTIEGILYIHDDAIMNVTQLAEDRYPFPTHQILSNSEYDSSRRQTSKNGKGCQMYRIFPDKHFESSDKTKIFQSFEEWNESLSLSDCEWPLSGKDHCSGGQLRMATDLSPSLDKIREPDGSILFIGSGQSHFMFVPTHLVNVFEEAATPHLKHGVFNIECAFPKVLDHLIRRTKTQYRRIPLCTKFARDIRGTMQMVESCIESQELSGILHPFKMSKNGLETYNWMYDSMQLQQ